MIDYARRTKDLSIALEALSRIPDTGSLQERVKDLLGDALHELERELATVKPQSPRPTSTLDDEIPF